jgi:Serine dehydrogenase proteinase
MTRREERVQLIRALEAARGGSVVVTYLTSTRPNLEAPMAMDAIPIIHQHLDAIPTPKEETRIDLFLHSNGGDGVVPWKLITLMREYCTELSVLVPHHAFSAATLAALGADRVVMHRMGMLGPTDPTVANPFNPAHPQRPGQLLGISVEDVAAYINLAKEDVGLSEEDAVVQAFALLAREVHPLALGNVKRAAAQSRMLGEKLLRQRATHDMSDPELAEIVEELSSKLYFHGHPINRGEARNDLRLRSVEAAGPETERAMWDLYAAYRDDMQLEREFSPVQEAYVVRPIEPPAVQPGQPPPVPNVVNVSLDTIPAVFVESTTRTDVLELDFEVTLRRDWSGELNANVFVRRSAWREER